MSTPASPAPRVAAVIATYQRPMELARLLDNLARSDVPLAGGVFVADNAAAEECRKVCRDSALDVRWLPRTENTGPGAAWNHGIREALRDPSVSHVLVLDDDAVLQPDLIGTLLAAIGAGGTAAPLLFDHRGHLWGFPEPAGRGLRTVIRRMQTEADCRQGLGLTPHPFCWATGACMLYARRAFQQCGFFREDFWMLGEDLDFSMRVTTSLGGVFTAAAAVRHLPPDPPDAATAKVGHRIKFLALLQNLSFLAFHAPHRAHLRGYLAGNFKRYLRTEGFGPGDLAEAWSAFALGAIRKQPAGTAGGARLRERARRRMAKDRPE